MSAMLTCGCATRLCEPWDREMLIKWLGVDASVSDREFADSLKWLKDNFEQDSRSGMYCMFAVAVNAFHRVTLSLCKTA